MQFGTPKAFLRLRGAAAVHMPVWVEIDAPAPYQVKYPCADTPWSFGGYRLEARRNGQLLTPVPPPNDTMGHAAMGLGCRAAAQPSALPLPIWSFGGYRLEARRNGQLLTPVPPPNDTMGHAAMGLGCRAAAQPSALPL